MIDPEFYCSMLHGGLKLDFNNTQIEMEQCCLMGDLKPVNFDNFSWRNKDFDNLRSLNQQNCLPDKCHKICKSLEKFGSESMRTGMNQTLGFPGQVNFTGPARLDLTFDISCNLACRTCSPSYSTFWQKHLKTQGLWNKPIFTPRSKDHVIEILSKLDLSDLRMLVLCGGETLLGNDYWDVVQWLADNVPNTKNQLTLCFQTNGTQSISEKYFPLIEKFCLVKLHISLDAIDQQFHYLRWPADWHQVVENLVNLREKLPSNVMFLIEETISIFNLFYTQRLADWINTNFVSNREGDIVVHSRHLAQGRYNLKNCTKEYIDALQNKSEMNLVPLDWKENSKNIESMISEINEFDRYRNQSFSKTFPELAVFYSGYL